MSGFLCSLFNHSCLRCKFDNNMTNHFPTNPIQSQGTFFHRSSSKIWNSFNSIIWVKAMLGAWKPWWRLMMHFAGKITLLSKYPLIQLKSYKLSNSKQPNCLAINVFKNNYCFIISCNFFIIISFGSLYSSNSYSKDRLSIYLCSLSIEYYFEQHEELEETDFLNNSYCPK